MKVFLDKFIGSTKKETSDKLMNHDLMKRQVAALYSLLTNLYGSDKFVLRAGKLEALQYMRSSGWRKGVLALQNLFLRILPMIHCRLMRRSRLFWMK